VTERKLADAALRESEEKYAALFVASPAPFLILRPDAPHFTIADVNDAYLAATMRTRENLVGRAMFDAFPDNPDDPTANGVTALRASLERALVSPRFELMDVQKYDIVRPDGTFEERWWRPANAPVVDVNGNVVAIIHHVADVTAEHRAVEALRESEERFRRFGEASLDILWMRDAGTLQWTYLTPAFETIYGLRREEALEGGDFQSWLDMIVPEDRPGVEAAIERVRAGEQVAFEYRIRRPPDGRICWLRETGFPISNGGGKVAAIGGVAHDVTELRESGQRQKLLLAELQHRVRNIMAMIRSVARRTGDTAETVEEYVQHLEGRISAMARTQALLTRGVHAAVDLKSLILDELLMQAAQPEQYAVTGPDISLPPKAAEVLGLALHELATNAVKYGALSERGGRVDVRWALLDGDEAPQLSLIWSELGVRIGGEPSRSGFGTELVTQRVPYELQGTGTMEFRPTGLVATLEFPLDDLPSILQTDEGKQAIS